MIATVGLASRPSSSRRHVQLVMDVLQGPVPVPELEIVVHRALRRQFLRQRLPLAAGSALSGANVMRRAGYAHRLGGAAESASSVRGMPISYEVIAGLPIRPSSLLASYAIGFM
jgi:hypothetical protein